MVELSGKDDPFQHAFPNIVFVLPAVVVIGLAGKLTNLFILFNLKDQSIFSVAVVFDLVNG